MTFENLGSLITIAGTSSCLGNLMDFKEHGVYDPEHGKVDIDPKYVDPHNKALDEALLKGLDERCEVGQGNNFYYKRETQSVTTFSGLVVAEKVKVSRGGGQISFTRKGRSFVGHVRATEDCLFIKRTA